MPHRRGRGTALTLLHGMEHTIMVVPVDALEEAVEAVENLLVRGVELLIQVHQLHAAVHLVIEPLRVAEIPAHATSVASR